MRLAVIFHRFGPYHVARLKAAAMSGDLVAIELCRKDSTYQWEPVESHPPFAQKTVFPNEDAASVPLKRFKKTLRDALDGIKPDVVAIPGWSDREALVALEWCIEFGKPVILLSESTKLDKPRRGLKELLKRALVRNASAAVVGGVSSREYILSLGMAKDRVFFGYDVIDNAYFSEATRKFRATKTTENDSGRYFLASARFVPEKNLSFLIRAFYAYLNRAHHPWRLVILGDGSLGSALKAQIKSLNIEAHITLPGFVQYPDLPEYYGLASAFVHASTSEPWGLVVNEAMASGLPVLVSKNCGCAADLVDEGRNGFCFDPLNSEALTKHLLAFSNGMHDLAAMGRRSEDIIAEWTPSRFTNSLWRAADIASKRGMRDVRLTDKVLLKLLLLR